MSEESGLFIEDLAPGLDVPGGPVGQKLELTPEAFEARFGRLFRRGAQEFDPIYFKLAAFCKTTAVSENSPANLGARNVCFHKPAVDLSDEAHTTVLGRKFREIGATTGVCQVKSSVGPKDGPPTLSWSRECIVNGRSGFRYRESDGPLDDRERIALHFDPAAVELGSAAALPPGEAALRPADFKAGESLPTGRISVLRPDEIFNITRGLGNRAKTHYTRDSGYIVWGLLTLLYGAWNYAEQLRSCQLVGLDVARHLAPVYLTEQLREEEWARSDAPPPPEFLSSTLTVRDVQPWPGREEVRLVTAGLAVYNNVNAIGRSEYERQNATKALAGIGADGRLHVGQYDLRLAAFEPGA